MKKSENWSSPIPFIGLGRQTIHVNIVHIVKLVMNVLVGNKYLYIREKRFSYSQKFNIKKALLFCGMTWDIYIYIGREREINSSRKLFPKNSYSYK